MIQTPTLYALVLPDGRFICDMERRLAKNPASLHCLGACANYDGNDYREIHVAQRGMTNFWSWCLEAIQQGTVEICQYDEHIFDPKDVQIMRFRESPLDRKPMSDPQSA